MNWIQKAKEHLFAAEHEYLTANGWLPYAIMREGKQSLVRFSKGDSARITHHEALAIQKQIDNWTQE